MSWLSRHLRYTLLAGLLAAVPLVILAWAASWIETHTRPLGNWLGFDVPGLGILIALAAVYLLGLAFTSALGWVMLRVLDRFLEHVPGFHHLYHAWKETVVLSPTQASIFHQVVLVPSPDGKSAQFGFASGEPLPGDERTWCVFLPNIPNPLSGRLMLFDRDSCLPLKMSVAEAFKLLLSTGNYLPPDLHGLGARLKEKQTG